MNRIRNIILSIVGGIVLLLIVKFILEIPYRSHIPSVPDLQLANDSLKVQITTASRKAYLNPTADNLGNLGMVYHSSANYEKAAECYKLAIRKNKSKWTWSYYLGYLNMEMGESMNSVKYFETVIAENPNLLLAWYYIGEGYQNMGSNDKAELAFKKIDSIQEKDKKEITTSRTDYFPLHIYAKYQLAQIYLNTGKLDLSEKILQEIVKENRTFGAAYRLLANINTSNGNSELGRKYLLKANDLTTYVTPIDNLMDKLTLLSKSDIYLMKQIDESERTIYPEWGYRLIGNALRIAPKNKYVVSKAVKFYLEIGVTQLALPLLSQHLNFFKDDANEIKLIGGLLQKNGAFQESRAYFRQALSLNPDGAEQQFNLALASFKDGNKEKSLEYMDELHEKFKSNIDAMSIGINVLLSMEEYAKAKIWLAELNPTAINNSKIQQSAGMIAERDGQLAIAEMQFEKSFNGEPTDLSTIQMLGNILIKQELWGKAIAHFRKAIEFHPNEPYLLERLGSLLITCPDKSLRQIDEGMDYGERALDHKSCEMETQISAGTSLSDGYAIKGDKQTAITYLKTAIELGQNSNAPIDYMNNLRRKLKELNN